MTYTKRANSCTSKIAQKLLVLMDEKESNLALSADVTNSADLLALADQLGPEICVLKTHIDIIEDFTRDLPAQLKKLATKHGFLIFEDRKFADIGHTVKHQFGGGIYRISTWADFINAHTLPGPGIIEGLKEAAHSQCALILLAEMSSAGHLMNEAYIKQTLHLAEQFPDFVIGFITQHALASEPQWINFTPGINLKSDGDSLGQQYITPQDAILKRGSDVLIVGRGILKAEDPLAEAKKYRHAGWISYLERCAL